MTSTKRIFCIILAIIFIFGLCVFPGFCTAPRASAYLSSYGAYCYAEDDGSVSVWFEVIGTGVEEVLGVLTIMVEEKAPGGSWQHAATYRHTSYPEFLSYNDSFHYGDIDFEDTTPGYEYRAILTFWGGGMEIGDSRYYTTTAVTARNPSN